MILEKPYVGLQRDYQVIGGARDTNYLATYPNFMLRDGHGRVRDRLRRQPPKDEQSHLRQRQHLRRQRPLVRRERSRPS